VPAGSGCLTALIDRSVSRSHPHEGSTVTRRQMLRLLGGGLALAGSGGLLAGCAQAAAEAISIPLARPDHPVTWPLTAANPAIASGLEPERDATLQLYNWSAYINPAVVSSFAKKYKCKVEVTTFDTMSEALAKLQSSQFSFDVFFPTLDVIGPLIEGRLLRPLNHSYVPNMAQAWAEFSDPFYDRGWRYTAPYTIYTTGIGWRKDLVDENPYAMANPWSMLWNSKYKGKVAILDDYRESISLGLLKAGFLDLNTTDEGQITTALHELQHLQSLVDVVIDNNDYTEVPSGQTWIHHAWSGDMAASYEYLPKGVPVEAIGYWFPTDGRGPVTNDTMTVLASGKNPVLAHLFVNYLLDESVALENISWNGYSQPINGITAARLIKEKLIPPNLASTAVPRSYFTRGIRELELPVRTNATWELAWTKFGGGL
jgi:spermidine/putrescine transport system substrate-binding protein